MRLQRLILATIVILAMIAVPVVARALTVTVTVNGSSSSTQLSDVANPCAAPPANADVPVEGVPACVDISGDYLDAAGNLLVSIDAGAQVVGLRGDTVNQLVVMGTNITTFADSRATVTISYQHTFSRITFSGLGRRFYGLSLSGGFFRPGFRLAAGDTVQLDGSVTYFFCEGPCAPMPIIAGSPSPSYTVPGLGSFGFNNYGPSTPGQVSGPISCDQEICNSERLSSQVTMTLAPGDSNTLVGSAHTASAITQEALDSVFGALTAKIEVHLPAQPSEGLIKVILFGSPTFDVLPCADSRCSDGVDYSQVVFGPGMARRVKHLQFHDANHDGLTDAVLSFNNADANIACGDRVATLSGVGTFGGTQLPFSASSIIHTRPCP